MHPIETLKGPSKPFNVLQGTVVSKKTTHAALNLENNVPFS